MRFLAKVDQIRTSVPTLFAWSCCSMSRTKWLPSSALVHAHTITPTHIHKHTPVSMQVPSMPTWLYACYTRTYLYMCIGIHTCKPAPLHACTHTTSIISHLNNSTAISSTTSTSRGPSHCPSLATGTTTRASLSASASTGTSTLLSCSTCCLLPAAC